MIPWIKNHRITTFFILTYLISWSIEWPLVAYKQGWITLSPPFYIHYLASFGPFLSALIVVYMSGKSRGVQSFLKQHFFGNQSLKWLTFSIVMPILLFGLAATVNFLTTNTWPDYHLMGQVDYLPELGIAGAVLLWTITFGLGEETGWRGFALAQLQEHHSALYSTIILAIFWGFWHLPAFFYRDTYIAMGFWNGFPTFLLSIFCASVVFTWMFNNTRGNLFPLIIFHGLFNFFTTTEAGAPMIPALMSMPVILGAIIIIFYYGPVHLSPKNRITG